MIEKGLESVQTLDSGSGAGHNRRSSCVTATSLSLEPLGRRDDALPGPAHLTVSTRPTMTYRNAVPVEIPRLAQGVHCDLFHDAREYYAVRLDGERSPRVRVPHGMMEIDGAVIASLWRFSRGGELTTSAPEPTRVALQLLR